MTAPPPVPIARRHDLDALRAGAMLLGIVYHLALSFAEGFPWLIQDSRQGQGYTLFQYASHGFRMPLFFVLSGFFTAMLWRKRGLKALLKHRFRRIFLPMILGVVTIIPLVMAAFIAGSIYISIFPVVAKNEIGEFWPAIVNGNLESVRKRIEGGQDLGEQHPQFGATPLAVAVLYGQAEVAGLLIESGVDVNARNRDMNTALHAAAFLGHPEIFQRLIESGADPQAKNFEGKTPLDSLYVDMGATKWVMGLMKIEREEKDILGGRQRIYEAYAAEYNLTPLPSSKSEDAKEEDKGFSQIIFGIFAAIGMGIWGVISEILFGEALGHLWFLGMLCWLAAGFAVVAWGFEKLNWKTPRRLILSPFFWLGLVLLTLLPQMQMEQLEAIGGGFGPDTSLGLVPIPHVLFYYIVFFGFGALYFDCGDREGKLGRWWWLTLPLALCVVFPLGLEFSTGIFDFRDRLLSENWHSPVSHVFQVLYVWMMIVGCMGLFRALLPAENQCARYLSDSAYWLYLAHMPLVFIAQALVANWPLPAFVKLLLVCVGVIGFLLFTYHYLVRYTWIGRLLNGPRQRPNELKRLAATENERKRVEGLTKLGDCGKKAELKHR